MLTTGDTGTFRTELTIIEKRAITVDILEIDRNKLKLGFIRFKVNTSQWTFLSEVYKTKKRIDYLL